MSSDYDEILAIAGDDLVGLSQKFEDEWGKKLRIGHTDWVIEHDMLGEGHQKLIAPDRYFSGVRELWVRAKGMGDKEAQAMEAQADLLDGQEELKIAKKASDKLRAKAKIKRAECSLKSTLFSIKDTQKEMKCLYRLIRELEPEVKAKYDLDIDRAQPDIWKAKMRYHLHTGGRINNIPLPDKERVQLATKAKRYDQLGLVKAKIGYERDWEERNKQAALGKDGEPLEHNDT